MSKIILIGNYPLDQQESMKRFAVMLMEGFTAKGIQTELWNPLIVTAFFCKNSTSGIGKWLGYIDKWLIFPLILKWRVLLNRNNSKRTNYHICDHSNAPYLKSLPKKNTVITCHDVLAIRGAFGFKDAYCPASKTGKILQQWILKNLCKAHALAAVSNFTLSQLKALSNLSETPKYWTVIHNAFNANFRPSSNLESEPILKKFNLENKPYILHVGSALKRKNRSLLVDMLKALGTSWEGIIVFAGKPIDHKLKAKIKALNFEHRVVSIVKPNHKELLALYTNTKAFIFPSLSEGFGWPLIEAQACGAPVIASNLEPMPEVSNNTALHAAPEDVNGFAEAFMKLKDKEFKLKLVNAGFKNSERFSVNIMIDAYVNLHQSTNSN
ncbi:glycosyltransferase family 4 protein [Tamlana sp. 62-3]|uniref:Glycosyltransferase family 4 protein n=1 Tax=Neotamlana sargassicola TaxID=2883125 RepID=A0A9X1IA84_9FLAO|nr:glycosyltransferase family 1 protein [Tamlana sargassicola]MCB4809214.1 glycosyltransferase family 4 protein [Tamlana sargassicola]